MSTEKVVYPEVIHVSQQTDPGLRRTEQSPVKQVCVVPRELWFVMETLTPFAQAHFKPLLSL